MAQWKRAGPITQRSVDRNHALLKFCSADIKDTFTLDLEIVIDNA